MSPETATNAPMSNLERIVSYFAGRHLLSNLMFFAVFLLGLASWQRISKEEMPDVAFDFVRVSVAYPGASAEQVEHFITKPPSADLWEGQTDEDDLGMSYDMLDRILHGFELNLSDESIAGKLDIDMEIVAGVRDRVCRNIHKRQLPLMPKLGVRTIGIDWRDSWN